MALALALRRGKLHALLRTRLRFKCSSNQPTKVRTSPLFTTRSALSKHRLAWVTVAKFGLLKTKKMPPKRPFVSGADAAHSSVKLLLLGIALCLLQGQQGHAQSECKLRLLFDTCVHYCTIKDACTSSGNSRLLVVCLYWAALVPLIIAGLLKLHAC